MSAQLRNTKQRRAVSAVMADLNGFASAQQIHDILKTRGESIGLSTVYRSLQGLTEAEELDVVRNDEGEILYRRCRAGGHHHHLVCRACGRTEEVVVPSAEQSAHDIATAHGFSDLSHTLEIFGTCRDCSQ